VAGPFHITWLVGVGLLVLAGGLVGGYYYALFRLREREYDIEDSLHNLQQLRMELQRSSYQDSTAKINAVNSPSDDPSLALREQMEQRERDFQILDKESELEHRLLSEEIQALKDELADYKRPTGRHQDVVDPEYIEVIDHSDVPLENLESTVEHPDPEVLDVPLQPDGSSIEPEPNSPEAPTAEESEEPEPIEAVDEKQKESTIVPETTLESDQLERVDELEQNPTLVPEQKNLDDHIELEYEAVSEIESEPQKKAKPKTGVQPISETEPANVFGGFEFHWTPAPEPHSIPDPSEEALDDLHRAEERLSAPTPDVKGTSTLPTFQSVSAFVSDEHETPAIVETYSSMQDAVGLSADQFDLLSDLGYGTPAKIAKMSSVETARLADIFHVPVAEITSRWIPAAKHLAAQS